MTIADGLLPWLPLRKKRPVRVPVWSGICFTLLVSVAVAALCVFPVSPMPKSSGPIRWAYVTSG